MILVAMIEECVKFYSAGGFRARRKSAYPERPYSGNT